MKNIKTADKNLVMLEELLNASFALDDVQHSLTEQQAQTLAHCCV